MEDIDKFVNDSAYNYDGAGCCSVTEWYDDNVGVGFGIDCELGKGRGDSNGKWDSKGYGEGSRFGGHVSGKTHAVVGYCRINVDNLYGKHR